VKRRRFWVGLTGLAVVATGATSWAAQYHSAAAPESKGTSVTRFQDANTLLQTGIWQEKYHDSKGAARTYGRVLELDPHNKFAWYNLGAIAQRYGRRADARAAYDKALKIDPSFPSALFNEAILLTSSEPDRAIGLLKRALAVNPKAGTAHLLLGRILAKKNRDHDAADEFRRAVATDASLLSQVPQPFRDSLSPSQTSSQAGSTR
jgi:tetratricopeptide (TPR) repeat protein